MSADNEGEKGTQDLELTSDEANLVKGGMLPIEGGGTGGASHIIKKKHKKRKRHQQSQIGPYKGKH